MEKNETQISQNFYPTSFNPNELKKLVGLMILDPSGPPLLKVSCSNSPNAASDKNTSKKQKDFSQQEQKSSSLNMPSVAPTNSKISKSLSYTSVADSSKMHANRRMGRSASFDIIYV